jgi:hypothetical protein
VTASVERPQHIIADIGTISGIEIRDGKDLPWVRLRRGMVETDSNLPATASNNRNAMSDPSACRRWLIAPVAMK